jgi:hypothetical protein
MTAPLSEIEAPDYDLSWFEAQADSSPAHLANLLIPEETRFRTDIIKLWATRERDGLGKEIYPLGQVTGEETARRHAVQPAEFRAAVSEIAKQLGALLDYREDADAFEHRAVCFWPALAQLHPFLGMDLRADELIVACDILHAQFRLRPVEPAALAALHSVMVEAATLPVYTSDDTIGWIARLSAAGVDHSFPLSFDKSHGG